MTTIVAPESANLQLNRERWRHLTLGVVCMLMIANLQYGWTLFVLPLQRAHGWAAGGLIVTANLAPIAHAYGVGSVIIWGTTALSVGLIFANIMNGVGRPLFGWLGDRVGNTPTMAIAFALGAASYYLLSVTRHHAWGYIFFAGMIFFCWGNIFSLFPAMCTDLFGPQYATANLSVLYTAKGAATFLVLLGTVLVASTGSWDSVLLSPPATWWTTPSS